MQHASMFAMRVEPDALAARLVVDPLLPAIDAPLSQRISAPGCSSSVRGTRSGVIGALHGGRPCRPTPAWERSSRESRGALAQLSGATSAVGSSVFSSDDEQPRV